MKSSRRIGATRVSEPRCCCPYPRPGTSRSSPAWMPGSTQPRRSASEGDAHVIRNAGGRAQDAIRSLVISQRLLGTTAITVVHHTECGMLTFANDDLYKKVEKDLGSDASGIDFLPFPDLHKSVRDDVEFLREESPDRTRYRNPGIRLRREDRTTLGSDRRRNGGEHAVTPGRCPATGVSEEGGRSMTLSLPPSRQSAIFSWEISEPNVAELFAGPGCASAPMAILSWGPSEVGCSCSTR